MMASILMIDDDASTCASARFVLDAIGHECRTVHDVQQGISLVGIERPDVILIDSRLRKRSGIKVIATCAELCPNAQIVIMSTDHEMEGVVDCIRNGAFDFIEKPLDAERLRSIIERARASRSDARESAIVCSGTSGTPSARLVGRTAQMKEIYKLIGRVCTNRVTVLIQGESGTGKELVARAIHESGVTRMHPFIAINCSAIPHDLLESELFGHVRGAFTGAVRNRRGKLDLAGEGTLFLDEISELPLSLQAKLLRVIQEREFEPVGAERSVPMRARIIAATNSDLERLVSEARFREDLFFRLNVFRIVVPLLRDRRDDIPLLIAHFLERINHQLGSTVTRVAYSAIEYLQQQPWPGNVRELENCLLRAVVLTNGNVLTREAVCINCSGKTSTSENRQGIRRIEVVEKEHISRALEETGWDKMKASRLLGISRPTLYRKIREFALAPHAAEAHECVDVE